MSSLAPPPGRPLWDRRVVRVGQIGLGVLIGAGSVLGVMRADASADSSAAPTDLVDAVVVEAASPAPADLAASVVMVTGRSCEGHTGGSGWYLGDGRLVTASHVVDSAVSLGAQANGLIALGDLERMSAPVGDLTVATMNSMIAEPLALGHRAEIGDRLTMAGMARDGRVHVVGATVTGVGRAGDYGLDGADVLILDEMAAPGMSGGPVVDGSGRVVGVVRAIEQSTGVTLVTPVAELWDLLDVTADPAVDVDCE